MPPIFIGILACFLVILATAIFPKGMPFLVLIIFAMAWYAYLKQSKYEAGIQLDMFSAHDRGVTHAEEGDYSSAIKDFSFVLKKSPRMLKKFPYVAQTYFNRGNAYYLLGGFSNAIKDYDQAIYLKPGYIDALINRGVAYSDQGNHQESLKDYQKAIQLTPDLPIAHYNFGNSYRALGNYGSAIEHYNKAIRLSPNYIDAYNARGTMYEKLGDYTQAIDNYTQVIQLQLNGAGEFPGLSRSELKKEDAFYNRGNARFQKGDYTETIDDYTQVIQLKSDDAYAYNSRGLIYAYLGRNQAALEDFTQVIKLHPSGNAYYNQAIVQHLLGMDNKALSSLNEALNLDKNIVPAYYFKWNLRYDLNGKQTRTEDFWHAINLEADQVSKIDENDCHGLYQRALAKSRMGDREGATTDLEQAMQACQKLQYFTFHQKVEQTLVEIRDSAES